MDKIKYAKNCREYLIKMNNHIIELLFDSMKLNLKSHTLIWSALGAALYHEDGYDNVETVAKILSMCVSKKFEEDIKQIKKDLTNG